MDINKAILNIRFFCFLTAIVIHLHVFSQNNDSLNIGLPKVILKTLDGKNFCLSDLNNYEKPIILIFWKSCCSPNIKMLDEINEFYSDWKVETGVKIYAISIDDSRSSSRIAPLVNGKGWDYDVFLDINSDCKRAMNVITTPHIFIFDKNKKLVWQKTTYLPGEVDEIYKIIKYL